MIDERKEEMAALYALGVLDPHEARAFEEELRANAELRQFVDDLVRHSAALAHAVPEKTAPEHLKGKVLQKIRAGNEPGSTVVPFTRPARPVSWMPWAMAAALAVFCGLLFSDRAKLKSEVAELQKQTDVCQMQVAMLGAMDNQSRHGVAVVIWDPSSQTGVLQGEDMPRPAANEDYQLWIVDSKYSQPVNAGVFSVDGKGVAKAVFKPDHPISGGKFAVSIEKKGGVSQHEGPIVMASK